MSCHYCEEVTRECRELAKRNKRQGYRLMGLLIVAAAELVLIGYLLYEVMR